MLLNIQLFPAFNAPLTDICYNLAQVHNVTMQYLEITARNAAPMGELIRVVTSMHDAHIDVLQDFKFADSQYGLALRSQVHVIASHIPADLQCPLWKKWYLTSEEALWNEYALDDEALLPGEEGHTHNGEGCVAKADALPYHVVDLPPPRRPTATPLPIKLVTETRAPALSLPNPIPSIPVHALPRPKPQMIHTPEPPKELSLGGPNTCKCQQEQEAVTNAALPLSNVRTEPTIGPSLLKAKLVTGHGTARVHACKTFQKSPMPQAVNAPHVAKKPVFDSSSDSDVPLSLDKEEGPAKVKEPLFFPSDNEIGSEVLCSPSPKCA
ncbi:hypothetical protein IW261DRAFT_1428248 [Armillaria novae-zelandiae]|uniref:Uncharacterized protein n=1 Tax=Armillaria novae-zelandiae TaxID=153914 RepID=A0AA39TKC9_9AGAR|nr:hypothetical protein IW261DRAFT_1428248 [Armillaria novae-zelandiae]